MKTLIIAEAGVNHNGDLSAALKLVEASAAAGADIVKFQTFTASSLVTRQAPKAPYQFNTTAATESQHAMLSRLELTPEMHTAIIARCHELGVEFLSTGFDIASVDLLVQLGVGRLKIPSGEITNLPYLRHLGGLGRPVILSTGMATLEEIDAALDVLERSGTPRRAITVLQCTTAYPTPPEDVNLRAMLTIARHCRVEIGLSDHTAGIDVAIAAVALGARVIEKHFTLDRRLPGPDQKASLEPDELAHMVRAIRTVEAALGDGEKKPTSVELTNRDVARKSIVAARDIAAGEIFTPENVTTKRPGTGLSPMRYDDVIGRTARRSFLADELIESEFLN